VRAHKANSMHLRTLSPLCPRRPHHRTRTRNSTTPPGPQGSHPNLTCRPRKPLCRRCSRRVSEQRIAANWAPGPPRKRSAQSLRADAGIMCVSRRAHLACRRARAIAISVVAGEARGSTPQAARAALSMSRGALYVRGKTGGKKTTKQKNTGPIFSDRLFVCKSTVEAGPAENGV